MQLDNWPPAKGPPPAHLSTRVTHQPTHPSRKDFRFELPIAHRRERRDILEAIGNPELEKVSMSSVGVADYPGEIPGDHARTNERLDLLYHVETLMQLEPQEASRLVYAHSRWTLVSELPAKPLRVRLTYPLSTGVEVTVRPFIEIYHYPKDLKKIGKRRMTVGYLLWTLAKEYSRIYVNWKKYGIWGHGLSDLYFEGMALRKGGMVDVQVGSQ